MTALTIKQARFVEEYIALGNASEAYRRVYCPADSSLNCGNRARDLKADPKIAAAIQEYRDAAAEAVAYTLEDLLRFHKRIMEYDPNEIIRNRRGACRYCYGEDHAFQWKAPEYLEALAKAEREEGRPLPDPSGGFGYNITLDPAPECPMCHGEGVAHVILADTTKLSETARAGYHGLKVTKDGVQVIMPDRQKSADAYARLAGVDPGAAGKATVDMTLLHAAINLENVDPVEASKIYARLMNGPMSA